MTEAPAWQKHPVLLGILAVTFALGLLFLAHFVWMVTTRLGAEPRVEDWMTPRHVVHAFGVPEAAIAPLLGTPPGPLPFASLRDLATAQDKTPEALVAEVQAQVDMAEGLSVEGGP